VRFSRYGLTAALVLLGAIGLSASAPAQQLKYPPGFQNQNIATNGTTLHVRVGGKGPAVVLLHGYGETGDMWAPLAAEFARERTVIAPDLRGMGLSARAEKGFDKKNQAEDIAGVMDALKIASADVIAHDIGNMVAFALAAPSSSTRHPSRPDGRAGSRRRTLGRDPEEPAALAFSLRRADMERLVAGRERIYLDRFWNEFSADPKRFGEASRRHYARLYARPGAMRAGFLQFAAFDQDALDNRAFLAAGRLKMPLLAVGGDRSFGATMAAVMRAAADDVREAVIQDSGHWLMEEQPAATITAIQSFLAQR